MSSPEASPTASKGRRLILGGGVAVGLFVGSFAMNWYGHRMSAPDDEPPHAATLSSGKKAGGAHGVNRTSEPALGRADRYFRDENYAAALGLYQALAADTHEAPAAVLTFRIGQCQEALGNAEPALAGYRQAASQDATEALRGSAQVAQARVLLRMQRHREARQLLYPLLLAGSDPAASPAVLASARYWLALALCRGAMPDTVPGDVAMLAPAPRLPLDPLHELPTAPQTAAEQAPHAADALIVPQTAPGQDKLVRRAGFALVPAGDLFDILAKTAGLRVEWTPGARAAVQEHALHLELAQWRVADLGAVLADCLGLVCQFDGPTLRLATPAEAAPQAQRAFQLDLARWSVRAAVQAQPGHRLVAPAYLHLANLEAANGKPDEALGWYERLVRQRPTAREAVVARFNQGMLLARRADYDGARASLIRALDLAPGHELAPLVLLHLGRMELEAGEARLALNHLRRAHAIAAGSAHQPRIALTLAAAFLLADEPRSAHDTLVQERRHLRTEPANSTAAVLDAVARHRLARMQGPARAELADLIAALAQPRDAHLLGPIEAFLCAGALRELSMWQDVAATCDKALPATHGPMHAAFQLRVGEACLHLGKRAEALRLFQEAAADQAPRWRNAARLQLAALDLQDGKANDCIRRCQELWHAHPAADNAALLRLWGLACEQLGEHAKAARCFAGFAPD